MTGRHRLLLALAWGAAAFLLVVALARGPGISREEARVLAAAGASPGPAGAVPAPRPPLPALLSRATEAVAVRGAHLSHLTGYRLAPALAAGLLAALVALLAFDLGGALAGALAPALLLCAPRLLLPVVQAGPAAPGAALALATLLAYRRAAEGARRPSRVGWAIPAGLLFGLALATQLEALALLGAAALHAACLFGLRRFSEPGPEVQASPHRPSTPGSLREPYARGDREAGRASDAARSSDAARPGAPAALSPDALPPRPHPRSALLAVGAMAIVGPAVAVALWPSLWADPLHRVRAALAAVPGETPVLYLGQLLASPHPPWGYPLAVSALALPLALAVAFAGGLVHALARLLRGASSPAERSDELLLLLAALAPLVAAQAGLAARAPGPAPWLAAFPVLAALAARAVIAAARAALPSRARVAAACLAAGVLAPGLVAAVRAYPHLGASWGELAGGTPGAASLGMPRHDGDAAAALLADLSSRAPPGARIHWTSMPPAALAVYAADGRLRPDLTTAASLDEADLAVVPLAGRPRQDEYRVWAAFQTSTPVAGIFLDEVPLAWVYARPGAWR